MLYKTIPLYIKFLTLALHVTYSRCHIDVSELEDICTDDIVHPLQEESCDDVLPEDLSEHTPISNADEITGQPCCIAYEQCLLQLASQKVFTVSFTMFICSTIFPFR